MKKTMKHSRKFKNDFASAIKSLEGKGVDVSSPHARRHMKRFIYTCSKMPHHSGIVVDLGGSSIFDQLLGTIFPELKIIPADHPVVRAGGTAPIRNREITPNVERTKFFDFENAQYPFDTNSIDGVLLLEVIEHFVESPQHCLSEIRRILKPDGYLMISTPNILSWKHIFCAVKGIEPLEFSEYKKLSNGKTLIQHTKEYTPYEIEKVIQEYFSDCRIWTKTMTKARTLSLLEKLFVPALVLIAALLLRHPKHIFIRGQKTFAIGFKKEGE